MTAVCRRQDDGCWLHSSGAIIHYQTMGRHSNVATCQVRAIWQRQMAGKALD